MLNFFSSQSSPKIKLKTTEEISKSEQNIIMQVTKNGKKIASEKSFLSYEAVHKLLTDYKIETILDIGAGMQEHTNIMRAMEKKVTTIDLYYPVSYDDKNKPPKADIEADFLDHDFSDTKYDAIFCSHILEHQRNVGIFCEKMFDILQEDGVLAITVPPLVTNHITFKHIEQFNAGYLIYQLVSSGFDCSDCNILVYGYNLSVIVRKKPNNVPRTSFAYDIDTVLPYFPSCFEKTGINFTNGAIKNYNWKSVTCIPPHTDWTKY